ncbi:DHA2 family efflux MFS transporter permease subunit [Paenibacillus nanensis]|uniref:DHA2 family efflux MFS transporter permease subunit n=1 Tax=Paenibacillus nanensis TaxID=393251 RepID=A0A3A1UXQ9_9BACL|nr:MDR family MFS transporter [Paenibacillus nanensis]RIX52486.1 DHA2 family efflux MFS transporter permease subunit [Paenibacillus nanensis]
MAAKTNKTAWIVAGLLLSILMSSMDNTILATSMGTIVGELGGMDQFVWVMSAYMIAEMAGMPIFGKLSDMYGRKRFFVFGIVTFMIGSALCGTADSIMELSIYRAIQGIGGGALIPISFTIMFDAVSPENRGKLMGLFGAVFGLSSIFGPLLGAYITDYISWQWVFYVNIPLGLLALLLIFVNYKEARPREKLRIDWLGAVTLVGAVVCLMFALEFGGKLYAWSSPVILGLFTGFVLLAAAFVIAERRASEPIISFGMFRDRLFASSNLVAILSGAAYITASVYIPIFMQGVLGGTATNSGLVLLPMMLGTVVSATSSGFLMNRFSYRSILVTTLSLLVIGIGLLTTIQPETPRLVITLYMILVGLGIGSSFSILTNAAIHSLPATRRGSANATLNFLRSLGMTLGITIFGILQSHGMTNNLSDSFAANGIAAPDGLDVKDPYMLMTPETRMLIPDNALSLVTSGLADSIASIFAWGIIPAVLALAAAWRMSGAKHDPKAELEAHTAAH